jgi:hypothetical protein
LALLHAFLVPGGLEPPDPRVRAGISVFARLDDEQNASMVRRMDGDLKSGVWETRNAGLLELEEIDLGYRLLVAEFDARSHVSSVN